MISSLNIAYKYSRECRDGPRKNQKCRKKYSYEGIIEDIVYRKGPLSCIFTLTSTTSWQLRQKWSKVLLYKSKTHVDLSKSSYFSQKNHHEASLSMYLQNLILTQRGPYSDFPERLNQIFTFPLKDMMNMHFSFVIWLYLFTNFTFIEKNKAPSIMEKYTLGWEDILKNHFHGMWHEYFLVMTIGSIQISYRICKRWFLVGWNNPYPCVRWFKYLPSWYCFFDFFEVYPLSLDSGWDDYFLQFYFYVFLVGIEVPVIRKAAIYGDFIPWYCHGHDRKHHHHAAPRPGRHWSFLRL